MERSAIKSKNYAARLAVPLSHMEDGHWKNGSLLLFLFLHHPRCHSLSIVQAFCCI